MQRVTTPAVLLVIFVLAGGCSHQVNGGPETGVEMSRFRNFHVVQDEQGDVATAIQQDLTARGMTITAGAQGAAPPTAQVSVISHDKWVWDITMYPLEVKIEMVDAKTGALLASGRCYRTSAVRASPKVMVKEITDKIFATAPKAVASAQ